MPNLTTYTLEFCSGLHRGTRGVNLEEAGVHLPADTLFAALVQAWRHCGGDAEAFGAGGKMSTILLKLPALGSWE